MSSIVWPKNVIVYPFGLIDHFYFIIINHVFSKFCNNNSLLFKVQRICKRYIIQDRSLDFFIYKSLDSRPLSCPPFLYLCHLIFWVKYHIFNGSTRSKLFIFHQKSRDSIENCNILLFDECFLHYMIQKGFNDFAIFPFPTFHSTIQKKKISNFQESLSMSMSCIEEEYEVSNHILERRSTPYQRQKFIWIFKQQWLSVAYFLALVYF